MELNEQGLLEELLAMRRGNWDSFSAETNEYLFSNPYTLDYYLNENPPTMLPNSFSQEFSTPFEQDLSHNSFNGASYCPFSDEFSMNDSLETMSFPPIQEDYSNFNMVENDEEPNLLADELQGALKMEQIRCPDARVFNIGASLDRKNRAKKMEGQPSKNLMAERRRRKLLNDRLSMLRSIVPKISKMDRTAILGDTIDYMKELLERIGNLQQEIKAESSLFGNVKPSETLVRNTPKFEVERRNADTGIEICCTGKPGWLLSTVSTLESLALEIEQCLISCFSDFAMQASCSEDVEQRALVSSEDIKQALFRAAGYGGRCL